MVTTKLNKGNVKEVNIKLTPPQVLILFMIHLKPYKYNKSYLSSLIGVTPGTIKRNVKVLIDAGYLNQQKHKRAKWEMKSYLLAITQKFYIDLGNQATRGEENAFLYYGERYNIYKDLKDKSNFGLLIFDELIKKATYNLKDLKDFENTALTLKKNDLKKNYHTNLKLRKANAMKRKIDPAHTELYKYFYNKCIELKPDLEYELIAERDAILKKYNLYKK